MKTVFCFILLFNICYCVEHGDDPEDYWKNLHEGLYRANVKKPNEKGRLTHHQPHVENDNSVIQPCHLDDLTCIRRVFAQHSKCKPVEGPAPDPYMMQRLDVPIPHANLTFSLINAQVKGLNEWKIKNFYINKATDRLLLEVVFDRIVVASPGAITTCYRKGKEPVEVTDYSIIEYYGISFTLTIPNIKDLQLAEGHVFTYVAEADPLYTLGPAVRSERDPDFIKSVSNWLGFLGRTMHEIWETQGPAFMSMFLHSSLCDFRNL